VSAGRPPWSAEQPRPGAGAIPLDALERGVADRVRVVAEAQPDRIALSTPTGRVTYGELVAAIGTLAHGIVDRTPEGNVPVALQMRHDGPLVTAMLAVMAAGKVVHVLDPEAPDEVRKALLADSRPALLVVDEENLESAGVVAPSGTTVVTDAELLQHVGSGFPDVTVGPDDGAMLAYTSGTTGSPKGALIPHRALLQLGVGATEGLAIGPDDRLPMMFPLAMAVASYPLFLPLFHGGTLCVLDVRSVGLAPLPEWFASEGITVMYLSPTVIRFVADTVDELPLPNLRLVVLGGERVDLAAAQVAWDLFGTDIELANGYGLTETGVLTFFFVDQEHPPAADATVPVGHAIPDTELLVVDEQGEPVPAGTTGQVLVRSRNLFQGYWGRPDLSARALRADEATGVPVYDTGDLGRLDEQGCLELVGRSDAQVKVRGHRVVIGEVEEALLALDVVKDAVVVHHEVDSVGGLLAFVVPAEGSGDDDEATSVSVVRDALADRVAAPMVPGTFVLLDELPTLPNGKLDRQALRAPVGDRPALRTPLRDPRDELERQVVALWEALLDVRPVGTADDFFELGGHSLLAASMLIQLEEAFDVAIPMSELVHAATVEHLASVIRGGGAASSRSTLVEVQPGDGTRPPLFWGHDLHGSAFRFQALGEALGADQPLYSFESPFLDPEPPPFQTLQMLALAYATDLTRAFPEGPYLLGGYSFGGVLMFEVAKHLLRDGHQVGLLAIVDVGPGYRGEHYAPDRRPDKPWLGIAGPPDESLSLKEKAAYYRGMSSKGLARHLVWRTGMDWYLEPYLFWKDRRDTGQIAPGHRLWYAWRKHWELGAKEWDRGAGGYPGRIDLIWCEPSASADGTMGWGPVAEGGVHVHRVPEAHEYLMDADQVGSTAAVLRRLVDEVIAEPS
jgi:amino acid adenylation domain-containing protein